MSGVVVQWKFRSDEPEDLSDEEYLHAAPEVDGRDPVVEREARKLLLRERAAERAAEIRAEEDGRALRYGVDGASFVLDAPLTVPTLWGEGQKVLWARNEALLVVGPQGVGKSTTAQQLVMHRIGARGENLFGFPVEVDERPVLYLAMDRPEQIRRSLGRSLTEADRTVLKERLRVWQGPLPFDPLATPDRFVEWVAAHDGAGTVVVDSYKDLASGLTKDEVGDGVNRLMQRVLAAGIQWVGLHHQRKATAENRKPSRLDDVYGSGWLTAGAGSVVMLWGEPGAASVELTHLKQPMEAVGPLMVQHSHSAGVSGATDPESVALATVERCGAMTEAALAAAVYGTNDTASVKRIKRLMERLRDVRGMPVERVAGARGGASGGGKAAEWTWLK